jgi:hypothetical protein
MMDFFQKKLRVTWLPLYQHHSCIKKSFRSKKIGQFYDRTPTTKEARKKKLNELNKSLQAKKKFAVKLAQKAYKLFRCFVVDEV